MFIVFIVQIHYYDKFYTVIISVLCVSKRLFRFKVLDAKGTKYFTDSLSHRKCKEHCVRSVYDLFILHIVFLLYVHNVTFYQQYL